MKQDIIGITVCVNYAELLKIGLNTNSKILEHIYVITKEDDLETIKVCKKYNNVEVLYHDFKVGMEWFDVHQKRFEAGQINNAPDPRKEYWCQFLDHANKKAFNKSGALRLGQQKAEEKFPDDFYLVLDCDIVISDDMANSIQSTELSTNILYTSSIRRDYSSYSDFKLQQNWQKYKGPNIAGFFQLYKNNPPIYYDDWNTVTKSDMWFANDIILNDYNNRLIELPAHVDHLGLTGSDKYIQGSYEFDFKF